MTSIRFEDNQSCWSSFCCCRPFTCTAVVIVVLYLFAGVYFLFIPILFRSSYALRREALFCNHLKTKVDADKSGFPNMKRLCVQTKDGIKLGK